MRKATTPLDKLIRIEQWVGELDECYAQLDDFDHIPRRELLPRGRPMTTSDPCARSCPACALQRKFIGLKARLGPIHRAVLGEVAQDQFNYKERERERNRASGLLTKSRAPGLGIRGLICALREDWNFTAESLRDRLDTERMTYDEEDDNLELYLSGDDIVVIDLGSRETVTIKKSSQREYLRRARHS